MNDAGIIIAVLVGAWVIHNLGAHPGPSGSPSKSQPIVVNPRLVLSAQGNPGMGPTQQTPIQQLQPILTPASSPIKTTSFTLADVGYATDLNPATSLGRCKPDGTCFM